MKGFLKYFSIFLGLVLCILLAAYFLLPPFLTDEVNAALEPHGARIESLDWSLSDRVELRVSGLTYQKQEFMQISVASLEIEFGWLDYLSSDRISALVRIQNPRVSLNLLSAPKEGPKKQDSSVPSQGISLTQELQKLQDSLSIFSIDVQMLMQDLSLKVIEKAFQLNCSEGSSKVELKNFGEQNRFEFKTNCQAKVNDIEVNSPIALETLFRLSPQAFQSQQSSLNLGGFEFQAKGSTDLQNMTHAWDLALQIADLSKLPVPPQILPVGRYKGRVDIQSSLRGSLENPRAKGRVFLQGLEGVYRTQQDALKAEGLARVQSDILFEYSNNQAQLPSIQFLLDLSESSIQYQGQLNKPKKTPLQLELQGKWQKSQLQVDKAKFQFASLQVLSSGNLALAGGAMSRFQVQMPLVNLRGFENYFLAMKKQPLTGNLGFQAAVQGDISKPENFSVDVKQLQLKNISSFISFKDQATEIEGPLQVDFQADLKLAQKQIQNAKLSGFVNLTRMKIRHPSGQKLANQKLEVNLKAAKKGKQLNLSKLSLATHAGSFNISGALSDFFDPRFQIAAQLNSFYPQKLKENLPKDQADLLPNALIQAKLNAKGQWKSKLGIEKSPISATGAINVNIPEFVYRSPQTQTANPEAAGSKKDKPKPLVPDWPIFKNSVVKTNLKIKKVDFDGLLIQGIDFQANYNRQNFLAKGSIQKLFDALFRLDQFSMNLGQAQPAIGMKALVQNFNLQKAVNWALPEMKDQIKGTANGQLSTVLAHPSRENFIDQSKATGDLKIKNLYLSSIEIDSMLNELLAKIPQNLYQAKPVKNKGALLDAEAVFSLDQGKMNLSKFSAINPRKDLLTAKGFVTTKKAIDMQAKLHVTSPEIRGSLRKANSDEQGRFVFPLRITGTIDNPQYNITSTTINTLVKNTLNYEKKQAIKKVEKRAQKEAQKQVDQLKKKGVEELKKLFQ